MGIGILADSSVGKSYHKGLQTFVGSEMEFGVFG